MRTWVAGAVCLVAGIVLGWAISFAVSPRSHPPSKTDIQRLCALNPGVRMRPRTHIVLHHSDGRVGDAAAIDRHHRRTKEWKGGLGYDFVIGNGTLSGDGEIEVGHRWRRQLPGAHCRAGGMNRRGIGICFVGKFETGDGPTAAQIASGVALVRHLAEEFEIPPESILGHGAVSGAATKCPGKRLSVDLFRAAVRTPSD